ncbi:MAG: ribosome small subunit-dependent GTPase A [Betaproteobacteria bacterium]|jgi:ribosome biogenesis GTPase
MKALVTGDFGREYLVMLPDRTECVASRKGKKQDVTCGDEVIVSMTGSKAARIDEVLPRRNVLFRKDSWREKTLAANLDQAIIIVAPRPTFSPTFLNLCLVACDAAGIPATIMLNKKDLPEFEAARESIRYLERIGYQILPISAKFDIEPLRPILANKKTLLVGESGMGKSRTVNNLVMREVAKESEFSEALDSGKHTTTYTRLYWLDKDTAIIDSPGMQSFGLFHLEDDDIAYAMPEFRTYFGDCKFNDCAHMDEPNCAIITATEAGKIEPQRLTFYQALVEQQRELRESHPEWKR